MSISEEVTGGLNTLFNGLTSVAKAAKTKIDAGTEKKTGQIKSANEAAQEAAAAAKGTTTKREHILATRRTRGRYLSKDFSK